MHSQTEPLKLAGKWIDPRRELIASYVKECTKTNGFCNEDWAVMMRGMHNRFNSVDPATGEILIQYPDLENWESELEGYFSDEWRRKNIGRYSLLTFIRKSTEERPYGYGTWARPRPKKAAPKPLAYWCEECKRNHIVGSEDERQCDILTT